MNIFAIFVCFIDLTKLIQEAFGKNSEPWVVFCDENANFFQDDGEASISITMNKKCKKINSGPKAITCGETDDDGDDDDDSDPPSACDCIARVILKLTYLQEIFLYVMCEKILIFFVIFKYFGMKIEKYYYFFRFLIEQNTMIKIR